MKRFCNMPKNKSLNLMLSIYSLFIIATAAFSWIYSGDSLTCLVGSLGIGIIGLAVAKTTLYSFKNVGITISVIYLLITSLLYSRCIFSWYTNNALYAYLLEIHSGSSCQIIFFASLITLLAVMIRHFFFKSNCNMSSCCDNVQSACEEESKTTNDCDKGCFKKIENCDCCINSCDTQEYKCCSEKCGKIDCSEKCDKFDCSEKCGKVDCSKKCDKIDCSEKCKCDNCPCCKNCTIPANCKCCSEKCCKDECRDCNNCDKNDHNNFHSSNEGSSIGPSNSNSSCTKNSTSYSGHNIRMGSEVFGENKDDNNLLP